MNSLHAFWSYCIEIHTDRWMDGQTDEEHNFSSPIKWPEVISCSIQVLETPKPKIENMTAKVSSRCLFKTAMKPISHKICTYMLKKIYLLLWQANFATRTICTLWDLRGSTLDLQIISILF